MSALLGLPTWAFLGILLVIAALGFAIGNRLEHAHGGALTAAQVTAGDDDKVVEQIEIVNIQTG